jgi:exo-beta-1,3-glucanase (GH17 family)
MPAPKGVRMRRLLFAVVLGMSIAVVTTGASLATTSAHLTPSSQSHAHGVASSWSGTWSGTGPFSWTLYHGDGSTESATNVTYTSHNFADYAFFPCSTTTFNQHIRVTDQVGPLNSNTTSATETGGNPC